MRGKEWGIPIALGLLAAGGAWLLMPPSQPAHGPDEAAADADSWAATVALLPAPQTPATGLALLRLAPLPAFANGTYADGVFTQTTPCPAGDDCARVAARFQIYANVTSLPDAARFGRDGRVVVRATALVFDARGRLLFGNADAATTARFAKHGDFTQLPGAPVYLGNGSAPAGTLTLPASAAALFEPLRAQLLGLPVGAVASAKLDSQTVRDLYGGPLYATARIEALSVAA